MRPGKVVEWVLFVVAVVCVVVITYIQAASYIRQREVARARLEAAEQSLDRTYSSIHDEYVRKGGK